MSLWQKLLISLATHDGVKRFVQRNAHASALATRFVGAGDLAGARDKALALHERGFKASLFYLGEYVADRALVAATVDQKIAIARQLGDAGLDAHVSVDPTQIGYLIGDGLGRDNALRIGRAVAEQPGGRRKALMLDMEDYGVVDKTLALRQFLVDQGVPTAITLQAYLRRTERDLRVLVAAGAAVRLVKGAFAERRSRAWTKRSEIDRSYLHLASIMLSPEAKAAGFYPAFGTHDEAMALPIMAMAERLGWNAEQYEFEMLHGVQPELQSRLLATGRAVRLYLPFGRDWWPYVARRIGENPRNAILVARAIMAG